MTTLMKVYNISQTNAQSKKFSVLASFNIEVMIWTFNHFCQKICLQSEEKTSEIKKLFSADCRLTKFTARLDRAELPLDFKIKFKKLICLLLIGQSESDSFKEILSSKLNQTRIVVMSIFIHLIKRKEAC